MLHADKVSLMPFLEILTVIAVARDTDQILIIPLWGCKTLFHFTPSYIIVVYIFQNLTRSYFPLLLIHIGICSFIKIVFNSQLNDLEPVIASRYLSGGYHKIRA